MRRTDENMMQIFSACGKKDSLAGAARRVSIENFCLNSKTVNKLAGPNANRNSTLKSRYCFPKNHVDIYHLKGLTKCESVNK